MMLMELYNVETDVDEITYPEPEEDSEHLILDEHDEWVRNTENYPMAPPFTGVSGFLEEIPNNAQPIDFYRLFMTDRLIKKFKSETNRYAATACATARRRNPNLSRRSFFNMWKTVTESEIWKFLCICIHMGLIKKNKDK